MALDLPQRATAKRAFDLVTAGVALVLMFPLLAVIAAIVRRDGGPALHRAVRIGRGGRSFVLFKFRTMVIDAERIGPSSTVEDDPRITPLGRGLRRYKLDELPQLLNVIGGQMSLVGPRPQIQEDVALYSDEERLLLTVLPGMTDYASIRFRHEGEILRGSEDPDEAYRRLIRQEKIKLGLEYVRNQSLWLDLKIIALTLVSLVNHRVALRRIPRVA